MANWGNPWPAHPQPQGFYGPPPGQMPFPPHQPAYGNPAGFWGQAQAGWAPPTAANAPYSVKYPGLNPVLASDTTQIRYDVRKKARSEIPPNIYTPNRMLYATSSSAAHVRLISKAFPWSIEIQSSTPVTCEGVWDAIHTALQQHIVDSEWGIIIADRKLREIVEKSWKKRLDGGDSDTKLKRIDWLGANTIFKGLDKMEEFTEMRLLPGQDTCAETWVVKLGTA